ncbi:hypothetical protein [Novosphingobium sp. Leaf2]|uniref:hypothetical protein n=1 Tax=Novosphingobium sp. Leaf2 TaxID=1735670 RepID=UPI001F164D27|nr:hypothetical protein [Novosphingobium sp. Leaf2]
MIVSIIAIVGWLILVLRNRNIRQMGTTKAIKLMAIWAAIIIATAVIVHLLIKTIAG